MRDVSQLTTMKQYDLPYLSQKLDSIQWVFRSSLLTYSRFCKILENPSSFAAVFPETSYENPKISHTVVGDSTYWTSKAELLNKHNRSLYTAWHVYSAIVALTGVFEAYAKQLLAQRFSVKKLKNGLVPELRSVLDIESSEHYRVFHHYFQLRHLCVHNLAVTDGKFLIRIESDDEPGDPYVFYPKDVRKYSESILGLATDIKAMSG